MYNSEEVASRLKIFVIYRPINPIKSSRKIDKVDLEDK